VRSVMATEKFTDKHDLYMSITFNEFNKSQIAMTQLQCLQLIL